MSRHGPLLFYGLLTLLLAGCTTSQRIDYVAPQDRTPAQLEPYRALDLAPAMEAAILALDPDAVCPETVTQLLSQAPAPRIINLHGGRVPVYKHMVSFSKFLEGMGYPESRLRNPLDGTYSWSGYRDSRKIAGTIAWYYEREGLRPMMIGHSLGGFQNVRVLYQLAGELSEEIPVWNPLTDEAEDRVDIIDPVTGERRPVVGLSVCFCSSVAAGGLTRIMPNTWTMSGKLRKIPDSTDAFTGYYMGWDTVGGDWAGFGAANHYKALGDTEIRNVRLPNGYSHATVPATEHLLESAEVVGWINDYVPTNQPTLDVEFDADSKHILYAADAWHDIKKHWVLELQRVILAEHAANNEH
jgi:hypothetical protein